MQPPFRHALLPVAVVVVGWAVPCAAQTATGFPAVEERGTDPSGANETMRPAGRGESPPSEGEGASAPAEPGGAPAPEQGPPPSPAAPPAPPPDYYERMDLTVPPRPPLRTRGRHYHDGFYARLSTGFSVQGTLEKFDAVPGDVTYRNGGISFDALLGGTPTPGLVIGGGLLVDLGGHPNVRVREGSTDVADAAHASSKQGTGLFLIGPMIDGFPNPRGGLHIGGLIGPAYVGIKDQQGNASSGFGLSAWIGYDWWVADDWSIGGLLRLSAARTGLDRTIGPGDGTRTTTGLSTGSLALMFTALYH